jgi:hypothetical protein
MQTYVNFDLLIRQHLNQYRAEVLDSPSGQANSLFENPFSEIELQSFLRLPGRVSPRSRGFSKADSELGKQFGQRLFASVFSGDVLACFSSSLESARSQNAGLRIRLHLSEVPSFSQLPWEYLHYKRFLALTHETPIVRYLHVNETIRATLVSSELRILSVISSPGSLPELDVEQELSNLKACLRDLLADKRVVLQRLDSPTYMKLQERLRKQEFHILHFMGHGGYDPQSGQTVLYFEDEKKGTLPITGEKLGVLLHDHPSIKLAVLNACEGALSVAGDPFSGIAQTLIQQGVPAVVAMQFAITDQAALIFGRSFYGAVRDGYPVDAALTEARKSIDGAGHDFEWATPVLYLRARDGVIFDFGNKPIKPPMFPGLTMPSWLTKRTALWVGVAAAVLILVIIISQRYYAELVNVNAYSHFVGVLEDWNSKGIVTQATTGGFRYMLNDPSVDTQVMTTSQLLTGILATPTGAQKYASQIRNALQYVEATRHPNGAWGYFDTDSKDISDVLAWTLLPRVASLETQVWTPSEKLEIQNQIRRDVATLVKFQYTDGGWSPVAEAPEAMRTYSTAMSLWALLEVKRSSAFRGDPITTQHDAEIRSGLLWLLNECDSDRGFIPDPRRGTTQPLAYPGLTAQVLWIFNKAQPMFSFLGTDGHLSRCKVGFVKRSLGQSTKSLEENAQVDDIDSYVHYRRAGRAETKLQIENMRFFWYPWTLAESYELSKDETLSRSERQIAEQAFTKLSARHDEAIKDAVSCCTFQLAEYLYCVAETYKADQLKR